jgi:catechol 2,3-dioxygenase-like lactoylglutathione lyase family enzyme
MVTDISIVAVPVDNIDEALRFFCDVLGMEKRNDLTGSDRYEGERYVEVAPPASTVALSPYTGYNREPGKATIGEYSRIVLRVDDVRRAHRDLTAQGVTSRTAPSPRSGTPGETSSGSLTARASSPSRQSADPSRPLSRLPPGGGMLGKCANAYLSSEGGIRTRDLRVVEFEGSESGGFGFPMPERSRSSELPHFRSD